MENPTENSLVNLQVVEDTTTIKTKRDAEIFLDALNNPPKPNKALIKAYREYKQKVFKKKSCNC